MIAWKANVMVEAATRSNPPWTERASVVLSGLAILIALAFGLSTRKTAKRALELSERQEARRESRLDVRLNDSVAWRRSSNGDRVLGFNIVVSNPSDRASAITRVELRISYSVDGVVNAVKVPSVSVGDLDAPRPDVDSLDPPARLDANDAVSGWCLFRLSDELLGDYPADRYEVVIRDVHGIEESVQVAVFHEVSL